MRPKLPVIIFTVCASAGLGLSILTIVLSFLNNPFDFQTILSSIIVGLVLGIISLIMLRRYPTHVKGSKRRLQQHIILAPINHVLLSLSSGALLLNFIVLAYHDRLLPVIAELCLALLLLAALGKAIYYLRIGMLQRPNNMTQTHVLLSDSAELLFYLRLSVFVLAFALPIGFGFFILETGSLLAALLTVAIAAIGLWLERWLFFVEATA